MQVVCSAKAHGTVEDLYNREIVDYHIVGRHVVGNVKLVAVN